MKSVLPFGAMALSGAIFWADPPPPQYASCDRFSKKSLAWQRRKTTAIAVTCGILFGLGMIVGELVVLNLAHS